MWGNLNKLKKRFNDVTLWTWRWTFGITPTFAWETFVRISSLWVVIQIQQQECRIFNHYTKAYGIWIVTERQKIRKTKYYITYRTVKTCSNFFNQDTWHKSCSYQRVKTKYKAHRGTNGLAKYPQQFYVTRVDICLVQLGVQSKKTQAWTHQ